MADRPVMKFYTVLHLTSLLHKKLLDYLVSPESASERLNGLLQSSSQLAVTYDELVGALSPVQDLETVKAQRMILLEKVKDFRIFQEIGGLTDEMTNITIREGDEEGRTPRRDDAWFHNCFEQISKANSKMNI